jgi:hypothetical protein
MLSRMRWMQAVSCRGGATGRDMEVYGKERSELWRTATATALLGHGRRLEAAGVSSTVSYAGSEADTDSDAEGSRIARQPVKWR